MDQTINKILKTKKHQKFLEKKCQYPDCEVVFSGIYIAKYCPEHRQGQYRVRKPIEHENVNIRNQIYEHQQHTEIGEVKMTCALEGCNEKFLMEVFPTQTVYPKYCPKHRNEHKRTMYLRKLK